MTKKYLCYNCTSLPNVTNFLRAFTVSCWTVIQCTVLNTPFIHRWLPFPGPSRFASCSRWCLSAWFPCDGFPCDGLPWARCFSCGPFRRRCLRRRLLCGNWAWSSRCWCWAACGRDLDICAVHEGFLLLSQSDSAVSVIIAAPVVSHGPPPLQHAVITCQAFRKVKFNVVLSVLGRVKLPSVGAIGL